MNWDEGKRQYGYGSSTTSHSARKAGAKLQIREGKRNWREVDGDEGKGQNGYDGLTTNNSAGETGE